MKNKINLFLVKMLSSLLRVLVPKTGLPKSHSDYNRLGVDFKIGDEVFFIGLFSKEKPPRFVKVLDIVRSDRYGGLFGVTFKELDGSLTTYDCTYVWSKTKIDKLNKIHSKKHLSKADVTNIVLTDNKQSVRRYPGIGVD